MATKTIVRYKAPNEIVGRRAITVGDARHVGIFTLERDLYWDVEKGFWLDADEAGIPKEILEVLETEDWSNGSLGWFTIETQEVRDSEEDSSPTTSSAASPSTKSRAGNSTAKEGDK